MTDHRHLHALLVEDDPVSAAFLEAALSRVPMRVDVARDLASAQRLATSGAHDVWVVDANLPDGRGDALLLGLRAYGLSTPAIAHTAAREAREHERLMAAVFLVVLVKPLSSSEVVAAARMALGLDATVRRPRASDGAIPLWDDASALDALLGRRADLDALRVLFRPELDALQASVRDAIDAGDPAALRSVLHRVRASCGFVGAARLGEAAAQLSVADPATAWPHFDEVLQETLARFPE
jgi:CheY-like chemotaxis protein